MGACSLYLRLGGERQLFGVHPQWSADGAWIMFRVSSAGLTHVYRVSPDGGDPPREVLQDFLRGGMWDWIAFHPDGRMSAVGLPPAARLRVLHRVAG